MRRIYLAAIAYVAFTTNTAVTFAADHFGLSPQPILLQSAPQLAFGPESILFAGDAKAATLYAISMKDLSASKSPSVKANDWAALKVDDLRQAIAAAMTPQASAEPVQLGDIAVDDEKHQVIISAQAGDQVGLFQVDASGTVNALKLDKVLAAKIELPAPPTDKITGEGRRAANRRLESITDLAFAEGRVLVSGLSGQEPSSAVLAFDFPFREGSVGTDLEIYHGAHGRVEDNAPVRTFVPLKINGKQSLLAGYTCTPLVEFSLADLQSGTKVRGKTVAELGNWNKPLDMVAYEKNGHHYLLLANSARGLMKVDVQNLASQEAIEDRVPDGGTKGLPFEPIQTDGTVTQLAQLDQELCLAVIETAEHQLKLITMNLP